MENDEDVKKYFQDAKTPKEKELLEKGLRQSLESAYREYAKEYFETKGLGSYVSSFLHIGGAAADLIGTYMFWALGGAGFGFKGAGLVSKSLADLIDNAHYERTRKPDNAVDAVISTDGIELFGETLAERAAAYLPLGVGEISDLLRGSQKYDSKITARALYHAKNDFIKGFGKYEPSEETKIVPLKHFLNPAYAGMDGDLAFAM